MERRFDDHDLAVLRLVASIRGDRISAADIAARLRETTISAGEVIASEAPPVQPESPLQLPVVLDDLAARLTRLEAASVAQRRIWLPLLLGVGIGAGVTLLVLAVLLLLLR